MLRLLGEIAAQADPPDLESAEAHYRQALARADELGMRPLAAHCHLGLGKLYRRTGDRAKAEEHLTTATTMYREMDMRFWLEQAEAALGLPWKLDLNRVEPLHLTGNHRRAGERCSSSAPASPASPVRGGEDAGGSEPLREAVAD